MTRLLTIPLMLAMQTGCATYTTTPRIPDAIATAARVRGTLEFEGSREFLPATLQALSPAPNESPIVLRYRYEAKAGDVELGVLALFNPLTLLGCPTGSSSIATTGTLEVLSRGQVVKQYQAHTHASRLRTIYTGDHRAILRRNALTATARSIDAQLLVDQHVLTGLFTTNGGDE